jgi:hypothetical protein
MNSAVERRISEWVDHYNMQIKSLEDRPDSPDPDGEVVYLIKDVFTTMNGSWELSDAPGSVPQWARDDYLKPEFLEAGADHHLFAAVIDLNGEFINNWPVTYWSDGFDRLGEADYDGYVDEQTKESSGWANMFMAGGSSFVAERGESGPWCWAPVGAAEVMCGGGLPANHHLSTFVVWQAVKREELETDPGEGDTDPGEGETTDPGEGETNEPGEELAPPFERRISPWVAQFNLFIKGLDQVVLPDDAEILYMVKDIFTTHNGSWEPGDDYGSIPQWARDEYLKPFGAPDYFDDAGADHHLFAAVYGLDGELIRLKDIVYWSDGFESLNDPTYTGFVERETKEHSGWINIPIGPGSSYVPERGESGPWCWMPVGGSEVVCGGGLPAKNHISTFVVWQAVKRDDLGLSDKPLVPETGDFNIFLPLVTGASSRPSAATVFDSPRSEMGQSPLIGADRKTLVRQAAWSRLGISSSSNSDLAIYARANNLGSPITEEFDADGCRAQGFQFGIVYQDPAHPEVVQHMAW